MFDHTRRWRRKLKTARHETTTPAMECLFFERLPPEIRNQIYLEAFGNRVIHVSRADEDGSPQQPSHRPVSEHISSYFKSGIKGKLTRNDPLVRNWRSSVCSQPKFAEFFYDKGHRDCRAQLNSDSGGVSVGVMGWLLTCRQAYTEARHILYQSNTLNINNHALLWFFDKPKQPPRTPHNFVSVQLRILLCLHQGPTHQTCADFIMHLDIYKTLLPALNTAFPLLRRFKLDVKIRTSWFDQYLSLAPFETFEPCLFLTLDDMVRNFHPRRLEQCAVTFASLRHRGFMDRAVKAGAMNEIRYLEGYTWSRFWREVYPCPRGEGEGETPEEKGLGYWVREGFDNAPPGLADQLVQQCS